MNNLDFANQVSNKVIGCAIEVHKELGPGLLESIYENALCVEFAKQNIAFEKQKELLVNYKDVYIGNFRIDVLVENCLIVELKCVERMDALFEAQILSYMKLGNIKLGLLINFNTKLLKNGIQRFIL
jgi:GxxExxY protein